MKAYRGSRGITPLILNVSCRLRYLASRHGRFTPRKEHRYPLSPRASVEMLEKKKIFPLPVFEHSIAQTMV
jgi:hypothetical protein